MKALRYSPAYVNVITNTYFQNDLVSDLTVSEMQTEFMP